VILSHVTFIDRPPAWLLPGDAVASPSRTKRANISSVKACPSIIVSVAPFGAASSKRSAAAHQHQWCRIGHDGTGTSSGHGSALRIARMVGLPAPNVERPDAVLAHVVEGHRVAGWGSRSFAHAVAWATRSWEGVATITTQTLWFTLFAKEAGM
jgi:hypothetical protein